MVHKDNGLLLWKKCAFGITQREKLFTKNVAEGEELLKNTHDRSLSVRSLVLKCKAPVGATVQGKLIVRKYFGCLLAICLLRCQMCM